VQHNVQVLGRGFPALGRAEGGAAPLTPGNLNRETGSVKLNTSPEVVYTSIIN
jgi:hypothetical protein